MKIYFVGYITSFVLMLSVEAIYRARIERNADLAIINWCTLIWPIGIFIWVYHTFVYKSNRKYFFR